MAGRNKQPVAVVAARGRKHLTKDEIEKRKAEEISLPAGLREVDVPCFIQDRPELVAAFNKYAAMLKSLMPDNFGAPDADCLARYVVAEDIYEDMTKRLYRQRSIADRKNVQIMQDRAFKQAHTCASALGLTVTSRCKLVVPSSDDGEAEIDL